MKIYVTGPDFFWKNLAKMIVFFGLFRKIYTLVLSGNALE